LQEHGFDYDPIYHGAEEESLPVEKDEDQDTADDDNEDDNEDVPVGYDEDEPEEVQFDELPVEYDEKNTTKTSPSSDYASDYDGKRNLRRSSRGRTYTQTRIVRRPTVVRRRVVTRRRVVRRTAYRPTVVVRYALNQRCSVGSGC
jgi:hypothetical protein